MCRLSLVLAALAWLCACSEPKSKPCVVGFPEGCPVPLVCEKQESQPACVAEFAMEGRVYDSRAEGIPGARVVALDESGVAVGMAQTGEVGKYRMLISWPRDVEERPINPPVVTLRASAAGYQPFPVPPRMAQSVDLSNVNLDAEEAGWIVANEATDIMLLALEGDTQGLATLEGVVSGPEASGVLLVATQNGQAVGHSVSGPGGVFSVFNVPPGPIELLGFKASVRYQSATLDVDQPVVTGIVLEPRMGGLSSVFGSVQCSLPGEEFSTSVLLMPELLFDLVSARGESPWGLSAQEISGSFAIHGVPPGRWVALAAFENDGWVKDPGTTTTGGEMVVFETSEEGSALTLSDPFKITAALAVVSPGAMGLEVVTSLPITFAWADDASAVGYDFVVFDAYGQVVVKADDLLPPSDDQGEGGPAYQWDGASIEVGMIYQFRVRSWKGDMWNKTYISQTEDLKGVFLYQPTN